MKNILINLQNGHNATQVKTFCVLFILFIGLWIGCGSNL